MSLQTVERALVSSPRFRFSSKGSPLDHRLLARSHYEREIFEGREARELAC